MSSQPVFSHLNLFLQPSFDVHEYVNHIISQPQQRLPLQCDPNTSQQGITASPFNPPLKQSTASLSLNTRLLPSASSPIPDEENNIQQHDEIDPSLAITRLNLAIDEIERSVNQQITENTSNLLKRLSAISQMQNDLSDVKQGVGVLQTQVDGLRTKIHDPFHRLQQLQVQLISVDAASDLVARASRFVAVAKRLESQMAVLLGQTEKPSDESVPSADPDDADGQDVIIGQVHERELARAALIINEITLLLVQEQAIQDLQPERQPNNESDLLRGGMDNQDDALDDGPSLVELDFVKQYIPSIQAARKTVTDFMEDMIVRGLRDLSPIMLGSSLQTAFNLGTLPDLVKDLLADLTEVVRDRIRAAFDLASLSQQLGGSKEPASLPAPYTSYKGKRNQQLANAQSDNQQQWSNAMWKRLETLIVSEMGAVCSKVYTLEKVLKLKNDSDTGINFLDVALQVLEDRPSLTFWTAFAQSFEFQSREAMRRSAFLSQLLTTSTNDSGANSSTSGYTRLIRIFHEFFAKVSVYTDITYTNMHQSPQGVIVFRSLSRMESIFLENAMTKINDGLNAALVLSGTRRIATVQDAEGLVRRISNLLDSARFDPLLTKTTLNKVGDLIGEAIIRIEKLVIQDATAYTLQANDTTFSQAFNAGLATFASTLSLGLSQLANDHRGEQMLHSSSRLSSLSQQLTTCWLTKIGRPLIDAVKLDLANTLSRIHQFNFAKSSSSSSSSSPPSVSNATTSGGLVDGVNINSGSGSSIYMNDVSDRLWYLVENILQRYAIGETKAEWTVEISRFILTTFLLHSSLVRPLSEQGKLKLTSDLTKLEFSVSHLLADGKLQLSSSCPTEYRAIKSFRPYLFRPTDELITDDVLPITSSLPACIPIHQLVSRSSLKWPFEILGWSRSEYVSWIESRIHASFSDPNKQSSSDADKTILHQIQSVLGSYPSDDPTTKSIQAWIQKVI